MDVVTNVTAAVILAASLSSGPVMPIEDFWTDLRMSRNQVRASGLVKDSRDALLRTNDSSL